VIVTHIKIEEECLIVGKKREVVAEDRIKAEVRKTHIM
jgi:hypothetical protein